MSQKKKTIVFVSTYPPRECGIATFTQDLLTYCQKVLGTRIQCKVAAFNLTPLDTYRYPPEVAWEIDQNNKAEYHNLAKTINTEDNIIGVIVQHEYGIFGGIEGEKILSFITHCRKPMLVTLHTVLPHPNDEMRAVTEKIILLASTIVVLTQNSKNIIEETYPQAIDKVFVIPHGIHPTAFSTPEAYKEKLELEHHIVLSTFGLLSRGKGIEYAIAALPEIIKKYPSVLYLILGQTHPVIIRNEGEKYRIELSRLIKKLGLGKHVKFYDQYLGLTDLFQFLKATDIYIATAINPNQAVSGTLSYALGTGRAVVSTQFAQAKENVTADVGRLVPVQDSSALTEALLDLLGDMKRLKQMHKNAYEKTRPMLWSNIAKQYLALLNRPIVPPLKLDHLRKMTDDFGLFQFAEGSVPDKDSGYTLDDNARALIFCSWMVQKEATQELIALMQTYLTFIKKCQLEDGSFINYISFKEKVAAEQNNEEDLQDPQARALWALSNIMSNTMLSASLRNQAKEMFLKALPKGCALTYVRSIAFAIKSFALAQEALPEKRELLLHYIENHADRLLAALKENAEKSWYWFEDYLSYNNALLAESLLIAGDVTKNSDYTTGGIRSLKFLISKTFSAGTYIPIGHSKWYKNNKKRSIYDQQPEDPASTILALATAYKITHNKEYKKLAKNCFSWFLGNNSLHIPLYDKKTGGSYDGLHPDRVNLNQGAESLVSYLMSSFTIRELQ